MQILLHFALLLNTANSLPPITAVAFTPDGKQVLAASQVGVQVCSWPELKLQAVLPTKLEHLHSLSFSPRGDLLAIAGGSPAERGVVELWDWPAAKRKRAFPAGDDVAYGVAWNEEGSHLAIAGADKSLRIQPVNGSAAILCEVHSAAVLATLWLPVDNLILSAGVDQTIRVLSPASGQTVRSLDNHTAAVRDLALRPGKHADPPLVASAGADRTIRLWQPTIGRMVRFVRLPTAATAICWSTSGSHVLAACEDGRLRSVDPQTLDSIEFATRVDGWAYAVAASPDGRFALLAGEKGQLRKVALDAITP